MPDARSRRAHGLIDQLDPETQLQVKDWYLAGVTFDEISEKLGELGHQVSSSSVWRWMQRQRNELDRIRRAREKAQVLVKYLIPDDSTIEQGTVGLAHALAMEALVDAQPVQVQSIEDLAKVVQSIARIQSSQVSRERLEMQRTKGIEDAAKRIKEALEAEIREQPELLEKLLDLVETTKTGLLAQEAA